MSFFFFIEKKIAYNLFLFQSLKYEPSFQLESGLDVRLCQYQLKTVLPHLPTIWLNFSCFSLQDMHTHTISHNSSTALSLDKVEGEGWKNMNNGSGSQAKHFFV